MIVVLDASALVSAALKAGSIPERAFLRMVERPGTLIVSQAVEDEYREVLGRPKFDRYVSAAKRQIFLDRVFVGAKKIATVPPVRECRDPKDDKYLELAAAGNADCIVSSDIRHLLAMDPWRGIRILSPSDYLALG